MSPTLGYPLSVMFVRSLVTQRRGAQRASLKVLLASPKAGKPLLKDKEEGLSLAQAAPQIRK